MKNFNDHLGRESKKVRQEFNDNQCLFDACVKRMNKEKHDFGERISQIVAANRINQTSIDAMRQYLERMFRTINDLQEAM